MRKKDDLVGTYEISTGTAEVVADEYHDSGYTLMVNGVPSSHIVLGAPEILEFEYMRWIAAAVETLLPVAPDALRMTHLGGAGCSLPRYFASIWPKSRHTVVELDAKLGELVRTLFDVPRSPTVKIRAGEARAVTDGFAPASRDVIIRPRIRLLPASSFNRSTAPWRLEDSTLPIAEITEISKSQSRNWPE